MTTLRMPQPGERWRLRVRENDELRCEAGHVQGQGSGWATPMVDLVTVRAVGTADSFGTVHCLRFDCDEKVAPSKEGWVLLEEGIVAVPYTWLEPLDEEAADA